MKTQLERIAAEKNHPCVSISVNTHNTHPDNISDAIELKKLLKEATKRVSAEFDKRSVKALLEKIDAVSDEIDYNYNLASVHIYLSNKTKEIIKSPWPIAENVVHISDAFSIKPLIKQLNRTENYLIMLLSQSGVKLYHTVNNFITDELKNDDFPFSENLRYLAHADKTSDAKHVDNMIREFMNKVDKAVVKVYHDTGMNVVVICTENNYSHLQQVADIPSIYHGFIPINYNDFSTSTISADAWKMVSQLQKQRRTAAIAEMQEAVGQGHVITDLADIYKAAKEGRGDLLITNDEYTQPVKKTGDLTFDLAADVLSPDVIDDICEEIVWEVILKNGRAVFTNPKEMNSFGNMALKVRY